MFVQRVLLRPSFARIHRHYSASFFTPKRFYKDVSVNPIEENRFEILLDKRVLKTPKGSPLVIDSEPLALAVAQEWDAQKETIQIPQMRLTGLTFTTVDNPNNETSETLTTKIIEYLDNDTLLYLAPSPKELCELETTQWLPIVDWANKEHGLALQPSHNVAELATVPEESRTKLYRHFYGMGFPALNGVIYGVDSIKSVLLMLACLQFRISVEDAARLTNLEQIYQAQIYKKVEGHHDVQEYELLNRLSAAVLYTHLSASRETISNKTEASNSSG